MTAPVAESRPSCHAPARTSRSQFSTPFDARERTVADIQREHAELRRLFDQVTAAIGSGNATAKAVELMAELETELRAHFQMEEVDGIFDQVERDAPEMAGELQRLRADHRELLVDASHLAEVGRRFPNEEARLLFRYLFVRFRDRVAHHESQENGVVQRAYCVDVGTKD